MSLIWSASKTRMVLLRTFPAAPTRNTSVAAVSSSGASADDDEVVLSHGLSQLL